MRNRNFLTVNDLRLGSVVVMGKYSASPGDVEGSEIAWLKCSHKNDLISERVLDSIMFDAPEPGYRQGNPNFANSNLMQFLNADGPDWFTPMHENDCFPTIGDTRGARYYAPGFLSGFDGFEKDAISPHECNINGNLVVTTVRLPCVRDISGLGKFPLFNKKGIRAHVTENMVDCYKAAADYLDVRYFNYLVIDDVGQARYLKANTDVVFAYPAFNYGLRPVCTLYPDTKVFLGDDGVYRLSPHAAERRVFTDEELHSFLGLARP